MRTLLLRWIWFLLGLYISSWGISLVVIQGLGASPWDVLHLGVTGRTGISVGTASQLVGLVVILLGWALGSRPTVGMFANMVMIGWFMDRILSQISRPDDLASRWVLFLVGNALLAVGIAVYTSAGLGAGPRDSLMFNLTRRFGKPVAVIRNSIEAVVLAVGWLLGGPVGFGTLLTVLVIGPFVQVALRLVRWLARRPGLTEVIRPVDLKQTRPASQGASA